MKKFLSVFAAVLILSAAGLCLHIYNTSDAGYIDVSGEENSAYDDAETGILDIGPLGVRIHAPLADINSYLEADSQAEEEAALAKLLDNPNNKIVHKEPATGTYQPGTTGVTEAEVIEYPNS